MEIDKEMNILVVDDSMLIRSVAKKILKNLGFPNVTLADDGSTALEKLNEQTFNLVIADMNMPEISGIELLKKMREKEETRQIPFLLVTAEESQDEIMTAIRAGVNNYMQKPWNVKTLMAKIERIYQFEEEKRNRPKI